MLIRTYNICHNVCYHTCYNACYNVCYKRNQTQCNQQQSLNCALLHLNEHTEMENVCLFEHTISATIFATLLATMLATMFAINTTKHRAINSNHYIARCYISMNTLTWKMFDCVNKDDSIQMNWPFNRATRQPFLVS